MVDAPVHTETRLLDSVRPRRRYVLLCPAVLPYRRPPVVIDLHGSGSRPDEHIAITGARQLAAAGAVVLVPEAAIPFQFVTGAPDGLAWNIPGSPLPGESEPRTSPDDVAFLIALVDAFAGRYGGVHLRGYSGGARLAAHVAAQAPERIASVCCVAGVRHVSAPPPRRLPPLLAIHGEQDSVNPFEGGQGARWAESVPESVEAWAANAGCHGPASSRRPVEGVTESLHRSGSGFAQVRLISLADVDHSWPGTADEEHRSRFGNAGTFSTSRAHWEFICEIERGHGAGDAG
jgi:polyhydroxybutyrate depolymerase